MPLNDARSLTGSGRWQMALQHWFWVVWFGLSGPWMVPLRSGY